MMVHLSHAVLALLAEIGALIAFGRFGWTRFDAPLHYLATALLVIGPTILWARYAAPAARARLSGGLLVGFKLGFFALATVAFGVTDGWQIANFYAALCVAHMLVALRAGLM